MRLIYFAAVLMIIVPAFVYAAPQSIAVGQVQSAPTIDGDLTEWGTDGWITVAVKPSIEDDKDNLTGKLDVELKTAVQGDMFYLAARWPDSKEDLEYKNWVWKRKKYKRDKKLDDMFAVRFHMSGDYDSSMIAEKTYTADVWLWSAGRSNQAGYANDMSHLITTKMLENAAEYKGPTGKIIYIKKSTDEGSPIYENLKINRKKKQDDKLTSIAIKDNASGSVADVRSKGVWKDGSWYLEMSRKLDTGYPDDVAFKSGESLLGAIAVFNKGEMEHKSASGDLIFEF